MIEPGTSLRGLVDSAAVLDALAAAVVVTDVTGRVLQWNPAAERLYGYPAERMLGAHVRELFVWPDDQDLASEIMVRVLAGETWTGDFPVRCADGSTRLVRITDGPLREGGEVVGVVGVAVDVAEERAVEVAAADREQQLRLALAAAELGTWRWDLATGVTTWDERMEGVFGLGAGGFDGTYEAWVSLLHPDDRDTVLSDVQQALEQRTAYEVRHRVVWHDGSVHWVEGMGQATVGAAGEITGTIGCARDVTARVVAEQRLSAALASSQRVAQWLQDGLRPHDVPDVDGVALGAVYRPGGEEAEQLGGDWFDVLPQDDGTVVLVIGDVMGRGVEAAATMAQVRSAVRAFASVDPAPERVLDKADRFAAHEWPEQFVTLLYAHLDPGTGALTWVSAGHLPAVVVAPGVAPRLLQGPESPPLGLEPAGRTARVEQLAPGAALLLVTDGLVERPGVDLHEALGEVAVRLDDLLRADVPAAEATQRLVRAAGPAERDDDITVLLARLRPAEGGSTA